MSGSLGLGHGRSTQSSESLSTSTGYNTAVSGDTARSASESISGGNTSSISRSGQRLAFEDIYQRMYGGASSAADRMAGQAPMLADAAAQLFTGGSQFLQTLGGNAGTDYMTERIGGASPVEDIIASMKSDAASLFTEKLNPAITSRAVAGGTLGGGRQGVAQGVAQAQVADDFSRNSAALRYSDVQAKDAMARDIAANSIAAANTGLGGLGGLLDVFERGMNAELAPYSSLSAILGGPTTLAESESSSLGTDFSRSTSQSAADAFSRSFGEQTSRSTAASRGHARDYRFDSSFSYGGMGGGGGS